jgi:uncharacterized membrane protein/glutaredoxin
VLLKGTLRLSALAALPLAWVSSMAATSPATAADGVVRAVLFSSPTCPHCRKVREEVLPALWDRFGTRFQVAVLSTATPAGRDLYWVAYRHYGVQQRGVPLLVVGDFALVGSDEIPRRLPGLVSSYLGAGGVDWPPLPGLHVAIAASLPPPAPTPLPTPAAPPVAPVQPAVADGASSEGVQPSSPSLPTPEPTPAAAPAAAPETETVPPATAPPAAVPHEADTAPPRRAPVAPAGGPEHRLSPTPAAPAPHGRVAPVTAAPVASATPAGSPPLLIAGGADEEPGGVVARVLADPRGNGLAILVLVGMLAVVVRSAILLRRPTRPVRTRPLDWLTPLLGLAGLGVAAYLAHVEVREVEAVCGPVGDCNTVQQSEYARLFGVLPIGVLGLVGFAAILATWGVRRWGPGPASSWAAIALLALTGFGTLFSIYLTFLEPFVIGATCLWCLSSAVIMTTLHGLAHSPGCAAAAKLRLLPASD